MLKNISETAAIPRALTRFIILVASLESTTLSVAIPILNLNMLNLEKQH
ncbi:hypothetical protein SAMN03080602_00942 [Arenibacter troitsensis]|uniref:Uncharacterized protein n=1 Tax=Arenibacter troitsensis TaxID=188872 RepID=A0A1X7IPX2_9FLAO|nr:hypothetical protein SAMN03080602_00942 [Arenibacter troitsensis]